MKINPKSNTFKRIVLAILIVLTFNIICPPMVQADSLVAKMGGSIMDAIFEFLIFLGDAVIDILQDNFITQQPAIVTANSDNFKEFNGTALGIALMALAVVVGIVLIAATGGASFILSVGVLTTLAVGAGAGYVGYQAAAKFVDGLQGEFDIPMMVYTPYAIFSGQIPAFDVNFIHPMEGKTEPSEDIKKLEISFFRDLSGGEYEKHWIISDIKQKGYNYHIEFNWYWRRLDTADGVYAWNGDYEHALSFADDSSLIVDIGTDENIEDYLISYISLPRTGYPGDVNTGEELQPDTPQGDSPVLYLKSSVEWLEGENKVEKTKNYESSASILQPAIATWYNALQKITIVILLSMLLYVGIKIMLTSASAEKAKYKRYFIDWLTALCILFVLHYIMIFILSITSNLTKLFLHTDANTMMVAELPPDTKIAGKSFQEYRSDNNKDADMKLDNAHIVNNRENGGNLWTGDYMGYIRLTAGWRRDSDAWKGYIFGLIYLVLVIDTCVFTFIYLKRTLIMAFLTMIAPLIAVTYPLDKIKDGQAQAFSMWIKEYTFNALIQPLHLAIYTMTISTAMGLASEHPVYALVALGFIMPAEKFLRSMFGFEKASTLSPMGAMAGGALLFSGIQKLAGLGKGKEKEKEEKPVRTADKNGVKLPGLPNNGDSGASKNSPLGMATDKKGDKSKENDDAYRAKLMQSGLDDEEIEEMVAKRHKNQTPTQNSNNLPNNTSSSNKRKHSIKRGMKRIGNRYRKKILKSKPMKKLGRLTAMGIGGATLGVAGLAAGISSGDGSKTLAYTTGGFGVGANLGGNLSDRAWDEAGKTKEAFGKGYFGEDEYNNRKLDSEFFQSDDYMDILDDDSIFSNKSGTERKKEIRETIETYRSSGITDPGITKLAMHIQQANNLNAQQTMWAYQLAQNFSRSEWNDPNKRAHYVKEAEARLGADYSGKILGAMEQFLK